jgi:IS5 family transposase
MTQISRFISEVVPIAQVVTGDGDESTAPEGGSGFADYALVSLHLYSFGVNRIDKPVSVKS